MALPFIAGLAVGAGVALLFTKREKIKETLSNGEFSKNIQKGFNESLDKGKELSSKALQYAQSGLGDVGKTLVKTTKSKAKKDDL